MASVRSCGTVIQAFPWSTYPCITHFSKDRYVDGHRIPIDDLEREAAVTLQMNSNPIALYRVCGDLALGVSDHSFRPLELHAGSDRDLDAGEAKLLGSPAPIDVAMSVTDKASRYRDRNNCAEETGERPPFQWPYRSIHCE